MLMRSIVRTVLAGLFAGMGLLAPPAVAQARGLAMLDQLEAGQWELRERDDDGGETRICIGNGRQLVQVRHLRQACRSVVVEDKPNTISVHYTCPGSGYGLTRIRLESTRLVQIDTRGIAQGLPFEFSAEARRVGDCGR